MNGFVSVSFEAFAECIDLASGEPDAFRSLMLKRIGDSNQITITDHGKPCFSVTLKQQYRTEASAYVDAYAAELEKRM